MGSNRERYNGTSARQSVSRPLAVAKQTRQMPTSQFRQLAQPLHLSKLSDQKHASKALRNTHIVAHITLYTLLLAHSTVLIVQKQHSHASDDMRFVCRMRLAAFHDLDFSTRGQKKK